MERAVVLDGLFPEWSVGAPRPLLLADEHVVHMAYYCDDGAVAVVRFEHCFEFRLGMPGEEQIASSRLSAKGLLPYSAHVVEGSSWLAELEDRYGVVSEFSVGAREYRHYVFTFHDRTFECVSSGFSIVPSHAMSVVEALSMLEQIGSLPPD